ncbi:MAG: DUF6491 family protein [Phenylobacterium sp.]|uniref:DUF6491 family protein n=1 Tax=Phenylobacterium sp. TaxID=1871053 RepID=UPI00271B913E|nr:DUF6491 family protein [Phenylobacterium sp.]MDO8901542.1 DUF6491 family protein [Phenylobacterium sp.]MDP2214652.1 DUF6491 family protein [Phenylobacterium sp.]
MTVPFATALAALGALTLAGCAAGGPQAPVGGPTAQSMAAGGPEAGRACFRLNAIRGQKIVDRNTVLFRTSVGPQDVFRVTMRNACLTTSASDPLVLIPSGGSDMVCDRMDLDVRVASPIGATPCLVQEIRKLTPAEVAALPRDQRP